MPPWATLRTVTIIVTSNLLTITILNTLIFRFVLFIPITCCVFRNVSSTCSREKYNLTCLSFCELYAGMAGPNLGWQWEKSLEMVSTAIQSSKKLFSFWAISSGVGCGGPRGDLAGRPLGDFLADFTDGVGLWAFSDGAGEVGGSDPLSDMMVDLVESIWFHLLNAERGCVDRWFWLWCVSTVKCRVLLVWIGGLMFLHFYQVLVCCCWM